MTPAIEFQELDAVVERNMTAAESFLRAIKEIHDRKLYKEGGFKSWTQYCEYRRISRVHGLRLVNARKVQESLKCNPGVTSEKHLREIAKAPEELRGLVVQEARKIASSEGREPSTKDYAQAVKSATDAKIEALDAMRVHRHDADQPEDYVDEEGYPVPEELWDVWRDIPQFLAIADGIRSSGVMENARALVALGQKHKSPTVIRIGYELERIHKEMVDMALSAKPARVDGDTLNWLSRADMDV